MTTARLTGVRVALLDIEGTTTPTAFVHDILFPFARARLAAWFARHGDTSDGEAIAGALAREHAVEAGRNGALELPEWRDSTTTTRQASLAAFAEWLMDRDRKSPGLKAVQGLIWEEGYQSGDLRGVVYEDVPRALYRWHDLGVRAAIYSSGSELAQRRLFESTAHGDLTPLLSGFFDTRVGAKVEADSYRAIAARLERRPDELLFVSDLTRELQAAARAGCQTCLSIRPGNASQEGADHFWTVTSFDEIMPAGGER